MHHIMKATMVRGTRLPQKRFEGPKAKHESAMNTHLVCLKPQEAQICVRTEADPLPL